MSLRERIMKEKVEAQKAHDDVRLSSIRILFSAIRNAEIDKKADLADEEIVAIVSRQVKQLADALADFKRGNRPDLVEKNSAEILLLQSYLPTQASSEDIQRVVDGVVKRLGATSAVEMGAVMKDVMKEMKGKADGTVVRGIVEKSLRGVV